MGKEELKEELSELLKFLRNFDPPWVVAIVILSILAYRSHLIIKEVFTGIREHAKVQAEIALKQQKTNRDIAEKQGRTQTRVRKASEP
jgi:hypothetical protein